MVWSNLIKNKMNILNQACYNILQEGQITITTKMRLEFTYHTTGINGSIWLFESGQIHCYLFALLFEEFQSHFRTYKGSQRDHQCQQPRVMLFHTLWLYTSIIVNIVYCITLSLLEYTHLKSILIVWESCVYSSRNV